MAEDQLGEYKRKRDFNRTTEPAEEEVTFDWAEGRPIFVIQKHDASSLHYDLRIEVAGVLKSWAVPKGPSTDPSVKRLAVPTEDHPLAYADFEGVIPAGEYGGGTILVWDRGTYYNLKGSPEDEQAAIDIEDQFNNGHAAIWLDGEKLKGGYAFIRTGKGDNSRWLLIKMDDDEADSRRNPTATQPNSVKTGRSLEDIRLEEDHHEPGG